MLVLTAVKVGYFFNLFTPTELAGVDLVQGGLFVRVDNVEYPLYSAATYEQSAIIDLLLSRKGELSIREYLVK